MVAGAEGLGANLRRLLLDYRRRSHWRNITPPIEDPARPGTVHLADPERGWATSEEGREGDNRDAIFSNRERWSHLDADADRSRPPGINVAGASFAAAGPYLAYALVSEARNSTYSVGYLFASRDGDAH